MTHLRRLCMGCSGSSRLFASLHNHQEHSTAGSERSKTLQLHRHHRRSSSLAAGDFSGKSAELRLEGKKRGGTIRRRSMGTRVVADDVKAAESWRCACERRSWEPESGGRFKYRIGEEDERFVNGIREAQPYIHAHRGRTFVVVMSGDVVAGPYLDAILKVSDVRTPFSDTS